MPRTVGAALVIGGGIGGIQSALDLANSGFKVYLLEKNPSIGGTMAQLDKTFPTNDCSLCILSPKLVDVARHPNVEILANSMIKEVEGEKGNFKVKITKKPRYTTEDCVGCGLCSEACVLKERIPNEFDEGSKKRSAIYIPYPQAVPMQYIVDDEHCLKLSKGKCSQKCEEACKAKAIDFDQKEKVVTIEVGSIIATTGLKTFDPHRKPEYGFGDYKNVITSVVFERLLNASGPTGGHIIRPSDGEEPKKIAFIQCVGSRDHKTNPYCSSVCCTYAIKEAVVAREHSPDIESYIFAMDARTFGGRFEDYRIRAEKEYGVKFVKGSKIPRIEENEKQNLLIKHLNKGKIVEEEFDLVVLSVGLEPAEGTKELAEKLGIELNEYGFCLTNTFTPLTTSKPGIFVSGVFSGPKDIPETVAQASASAAKASSIIASERNTLIREKEYPEEIDVTNQEPRIGVFVCYCGINIGAYVDVPSVAKYTKTLPNVAYVEENLYTCSQDTQKIIKENIKKHKLNRIVVASCSPRTHEPLFQDTIREAGLNPFLFEMANIRDQCSWVHMKEPNEATEKSKELIRMAVAKATLLQPLQQSSVEIIQSGLVIGGGLSGMTAALEMSKQGFKVDLIEKADKLGGNLRNLVTTLRGGDPKALLKDHIEKVEKDKNITIHRGVELKNLAGSVGNFKSTLTNDTTIEHGVIIVATGAVEYQPTEYQYGKHPNIMTQLEFEHLIEEEDFHPKTIAVIHCVGARDENNTECGRICCSKAIKGALEMKKKHPDVLIYNIFKDIRTYGFREKYYQKAGEIGVTFIRHEDENKPVVSVTKNGLELTVRDSILDADLLLNPDAIVLSSAIVSHPDNKQLAKILKVPLAKDGFFLEAHVKLRPLDFATDGIFVCGLAQGPKFIDEAISQSCGAVARACTILSKKTLKAGGIVSFVEEDDCGGCGTCETICPYGAITVDMSDPTNFRAKTNEMLCKGCGTCIAACPEHAITMKQFSSDQIMAQIVALSEEV
jgi:heterodisulfide reductase subunit A